MRLLEDILYFAPGPHPPTPVPSRLTPLGLATRDFLLSQR